MPHLELIELMTAFQGNREQVLTVPVAGPAPFNALVAFRTSLVGGSINWLLPGEVKRETPRYRSGFRHPGATVSDRQRYHVSTTAMMRLLASSNDQSFLAAVDGVRAGFDDDGYFYIETDLACSIDGQELDFHIEASSWILLHDPQFDPK
jgi:hypothetical protein